MINSLDELIRNRKELIEVHHKNNFTDGIRTLLTDLYPDTAHFIYELLQNAEDMNATEVRFLLYSDCLYFEHNGTKRSFNLDDIDAITNIGNNAQKKDDPTAIGKFGVGFKAVFSYTSTPVIHSGEYHFKIRDYFVPETDGVSVVPVSDESGAQWTKFEFPFNNPKKKAEKAYEEILAGLKKLNDHAIIFLNNIRRIEYSTDDGKTGFLEREIRDEHYLTVNYRKINSINVGSSEWLYFTQEETVTDEHKCRKELNISVAFSLGKVGRSRNKAIIPVDGGGKTYIYFPAEKEYSGLRFHINAPFASTVARDSVRECNENNRLISRLSKMICKSLSFIKRQGLLDISFLSVLPNYKDDIPEFYNVILNDLIKTFQEHKLIPAYDGDWLSYNDAITGPDSISELFDYLTLFKLTGEKKKWVLSSSGRNSNAENFIRGLGLKIYSYEELISDIINRKNDMEWILENADNNWLNSFYLLCADILNQPGIDAFKKYNFKYALTDMKMIRTTRNQMMKPEDVLILPDDSGVSTRSLNVVSYKNLKSSCKNSNYSDKIKSFFIMSLGIRVYSEQIEVEKILEKYSVSRKIRKNSSEYFRDLLTLAEYVVDNVEANYSDYYIFLYKDEDDNLITERPDMLIIGKYYGNAAGELIAGAVEKHCLWDGYRKYYNEDEMNLVINFAENAGVTRKLKVKCTTALVHPLYYSQLYSSDIQNRYGVDIDYTISDLKRIMKFRSKKVSLLIWKSIAQYDNVDSIDYTTAIYRPNKSSEAKTCESSLIYYLKNNAWIPDKEGKFHKPADISYDQLSDEFTISSNSNQIFSALQIGSSASQQAEKKLQLEKDAAEAGMVLVSDSDYEEFMQWKKLQKNQKAKEVLSMHELLEKNNRISSEDSDDDYTVDGSVSNLSKRSRNLEKSFADSYISENMATTIFTKSRLSSEDEKRTLRNWYNGECQFCGTSIKKANREPYFIAKNIVNTKNMNSEVKKTMGIAWNSLSLCPNCAAKYDVCSRNLSGLYEQIINQEIIEGDETDIIVSFELDGKLQEIRFCAKHFLALQVGIRCFDRMIESKGV